MTDSVKVEQLMQLFNQEFVDFNTRLVRGEGEPQYCPMDKTTPYHRIEFAHGYLASALHEVAHWCIAGEQRRLQYDYGYWYHPDGRNQSQQAAFENVEVKPQALEWMFSVASCSRFRVSADNLNGYQGDLTAFTQRVREQVDSYLCSGIPRRAQRFIAVLQQHFNSPALHIEQFT